MHITNLSIDSEVAAPTTLNIINGSNVPSRSYMTMLHFIAASCVENIPATIYVKLMIAIPKPSIPIMKHPRF